eukprot:1102953-Rhodomonas_salina.2
MMMQHAPCVQSAVSAWELPIPRRQSNSNSKKGALSKNNSGSGSSTLEAWAPAHAPEPNADARRTTGEQGGRRRARPEEEAATAIQRIARGSAVRKRVLALTESGNAHMVEVTSWMFFATPGGGEGGEEQEEEERGSSRGGSESGSEGAEYEWKVTVRYEEASGESEEALVGASREVVR